VDQNSASLATMTVICDQTPGCKGFTATGNGRWALLSDIKMSDFQYVVSGGNMIINPSVSCTVKNY
jgi:hypothetical protein